MTVIKAVIWMPEEELQNAELIAPCFETIRIRGYAFDSIVSSWEQLKSMLRKEEVQVVVYAREEHIDPTWTPRFELAGDGGSAPPTDPATGSPSAGRRGRRPKRIR